MQVFIKSLLIDGHAFDFGVYTLLASMDPLRVYTWDQDIVLRFCSEKFEPFDHNVHEKYVCSSNYKNVWELDAFKKLFTSGHKYSNKAILNSHLESLGHNTTKLWADIEQAISTVVAEKVRAGLRFSKIYIDKSGNPLRQMFELLRFDFVLDKELNFYMLEVNMSPEMGFERDIFGMNKMMSNQVVWDTLRLVGAESYQELIG